MKWDDTCINDSQSFHSINHQSLINNSGFSLLNHPCYKYQQGASL